jgi:UDP-N-acetylglucosamine 2-epimerase
MQFVPGELPRYVKRDRPQRDRPLPDRLLVSGQAGAEHLIREGYPADRITICGPQRHNGLLAHLRKGPSRAELRKHLNWPDNVPVIFVAISLWEADTHALFGALTEVGMDIGDFRFVVKTHPANPLGDAAMQETFEVLGQHRCSIVPPGGNMYDYIAAADVLVTVGSSIAFEAMALGVMPIVFENPETFAMNSLVDFQSALFVVHNAGELRTALVAVLKNSDQARAKRQAWPETLAYVFHDLATPLPEQLRAALEKAGVNVVLGNQV